MSSEACPVCSALHSIGTGRYKADSENGVSFILFSPYSLQHTTYHTCFSTYHCLAYVVVHECMYMGLDVSLSLSIYLSNYPSKTTSSSWQLFIIMPLPVLPCEQDAGGSSMGSNDNFPVMRLISFTYTKVLIFS